jgi:flagellar basal-body rod modification protein FlgD
MAVSPVMNSNNNVSNSGGSGNSAADLSQSFMELLVAQMQNQDPTNPMDNNQLTSQLAQFNTAAGVEKLNGTLEGVGFLVNSMQQMNSAQWVGRSVYVEGDSVITESKQDLSFSLESDADKVTVTLTDKEGNAYTAELKDLKAGVNKFTYDDLTNFKPSEPVIDQNSSFKVTYAATNEDGNTPKIVSLKKAKVEGVSFASGSAELQLGIDGSTTLSKVYLIE